MQRTKLYQKLGSLKKVKASNIILLVSSYKLILLYLHNCFCYFLPKAFPLFRGVTHILSCRVTVSAFHWDLEYPHATVRVPRVTEHNITIKGFPVNKSEEYANLARERVTFASCLRGTHASSYDKYFLYSFPLTATAHQCNFGGKVLSTSIKVRM